MKSRRNSARIRANSVLVDGAAFVEIVKDGRRFRVQADVPAPPLVADGRHRLDGDAHAEKVLHPGLEHAGERVLAEALNGEVEYRVEAVAAFPVGLDVVGTQHVQHHARWRLNHRPTIPRFHRLVVGQHDGAVDDVHFLDAE